MEPSADEVRAALERILSSPSFEQAGRSREFLRFVVEESLAGRADRLKGYSIALAVFDKPGDFDAQSDPLVRVEAGRLRRRLAAYYGAEGCADAWRIVLRRGSYAPRFERAPRVLAPVPASERRSHKRHIAFATTASLAAVIAALLGLWRLWPMVREAASPGEPPALVASDTRMPRILVVPFDNLGEPDFDYFAFGLTEEVIVRLNAYDFFVIANHAGYGKPSEPLDAVSSAVDADYVLTGSVRHGGQRIRVFARLIDARGGEQIWTRSYEETLALGALLGIQEKIAREVATTLGEPLGPLYDQEFARSVQRAPADIDAYDCVLRFYYYAQTLDRTVHRTTTECLRAALERDPDDALAWGALAILYRHEYLYGYNPRLDAPPPLDRALEAARNSLDIDGTNPLGNFAMALVRQTRGDIEGFARSVDRLLAAGMPPTEQVQIGSLLIFSGDRARGRALLDAALEQTPRPPGWSYVAYVVYYLQNDDYAQALRWARRIDMPRWFGDPLLAAATAALAGEQPFAEREAKRLLALYPDFPRVGRVLLERWAFDANVNSLVVSGLERAGIELD